MRSKNPEASQRWMRNSMMKIDVKAIFEKATPNGSFIKLRLDEAALGVYYSVDEKRIPSIAFMTTQPPIEIESTKCISATQWQERALVYWTKLCLLYEPARMNYYSLCNDLIETICNCKTEKDAVVALSNRYRNWKRLFQGAAKKMSEEEYKGLFGELYFLLKKMIPTYEIDKAIRAWGGPKKTAKDFAIDESWYEIKTTSSSSSEVMISSITQLDADNEGYLVVVKIERMSDEYYDGQSTVGEIVNAIMLQISENGLKDIFIDKLVSYGYDMEESESENGHYKVNVVKAYKVVEGFPRITSKSIGNQAITKVTYAISLPAITNFEEDIL